MEKSKGFLTLIVLSLVVFLTIVLSGCKNNNNGQETAVDSGQEGLAGEESTSEKAGKDYEGDYLIGYSDPGPRGYVMAMVALEGEEIVDVVLREFQGDLSEKTKETYDYEPWHEASEALPQAVIDKQSTDIDLVSGATSTSNKFIQAVKRALGEEPPFEFGPYEDGIYTAKSDEERGWVEVTLTVLLGHIVNVEFTDYRDGGDAKTPENYEYEAWLEAAEALPQAVIEAQSADIDVVSGASGTSNKFKQAVERALEQAS